MSEPSEGTLRILQDGFRVMHENSDRMLALNESVLQTLRADRAEADRRFNKQAKKLRVLSWAVIIVLILGIVNSLQNRQLIDQQRQDAVIRNERAQLAEDQRKCLAIVQNATLARLAQLAISSPGRANGSGVDQGALARLREDVEMAGRMSPPDPVLLARIRDEVAAILAALPAETTDAQRLRAEVAQANDALLHVADICFTDHPAENPLGR